MDRLNFLILIIVLVLAGCQSKPAYDDELIEPFVIDRDTSVSTLSSPTVFVSEDITVRQYFKFMDALAAHFSDRLPEPYEEYLIARANPWIIDTLVHTDYYYLKERGIFNYDQKSLVILKEGDRLIIPDSLQVDSLVKVFAETVLDINIPEFKLRIRRGDEIQFTFPVRVGRNENKYLAMAGHQVDLRTRTGVGRIVRISRNPTYINPSNNHVYEQTRRDDEKVTLLPQIPWLEPEIDGHRYGQLIHPTTNPNTLGRAYSNGCIGTREGDAWRIYYYAPLGTRIVFRYDLEVMSEEGDTLRLKNIYPGFENKDKIEWLLPTIAAAIGEFTQGSDHPSCIDESLYWK